VEERVSETMRRGVYGWRRWDFGTVEKLSEYHPERDLGWAVLVHGSLFALLFDQVFEEFAFYPDGEGAMNWLDHIVVCAPEPIYQTQDIWQLRAQQLRKPMGYELENPDRWRSPVHGRTIAYIASGMAEPVPDDLKHAWLLDGIVRWGGTIPDYPDTAEAVAEVIRSYNEDEADLVLPQVKAWLHRKGNRKQHARAAAQTTQSKSWPVTQRERRAVWNRLNANRPE
jgi:hypothetical protein